jgi:hypothetical protein
MHTDNSGYEGRRVGIFGARYTPQGNLIHVDDATLGLTDVSDKEGIARHSAASRGGDEPAHFRWAPDGNPEAFKKRACTS